MLRAEKTDSSFWCEKRIWDAENMRLSGIVFNGPFDGAYLDIIVSDTPEATDGSLCVAEWTHKVLDLVGDTFCASIVDADLSVSICPGASSAIDLRGGCECEEAHVMMITWACVLFGTFFGVGEF